MRSSTRPPLSVSSTGAIASAAVFTALAPMASRTSTSRCTIDMGPVGESGRLRTWMARGPPPSRLMVGLVSASVSESTSVWAKDGAIAAAGGVGNVQQLHLGNHHGFAAAGEKAAAVACQARGKTHRGHDRGFLNDHRHEAVRAVDLEIGGNAQRQTEAADNVFNQVVGRPRG